MLFKNIFKIILNVDTEYDPSVNLKSSFHVGAGIINSFFWMTFYFLPSKVHATI